MEQDPTSEAALPALQLGVGWGTENPSSTSICLERPILKTKWHRGGESINIRSKLGGGHPLSSSSNEQVAPKKSSQPWLYGTQAEEQGEVEWGGSSS